jgi:hypothetical protein
MSSPAGKRKAYVVVLVLAVVAFICDRMFFDPSTTEPVAATAALRQRQNRKTTKAPAQAEESTGRPRASEPSDVDAVSFNGRISETCRLVDVPARGETCRDAMRPSPVWIARQQEDQQAQVAETPPEQTALEALQDRYVLTAVVSGSSQMAILGDRCVRVGQTVDGCKLIEVHGDRAVFQVGQHRAELKVPQ